MNSLWDEATVRAAVQVALKSWRNLKYSPHDLLEGLLLTQGERDKVKGKGPTGQRLATNRVLHNGIDLLQDSNPSGAEILRKRFMDGQTILEVAQYLNLSQDQVKHRQREALDGLANIIWAQEEALRNARFEGSQIIFPSVEDTELFGIETLHQEAVGLLLNPSPPWIIALVGMGGIGKTSLADMVMRTIIKQFIYSRVIWLRIEHQPSDNSAHLIDHLLKRLAEHIFPDQVVATQRFNAVQQALKQSPHLIIVDDLETEAELSELVEQLQDLANPSKFLLTTRVRLTPTVAVRSLALGELNLKDTTTLIRYQAKSIGLTELTEATENDIMPIYEKVGGNPLALKLVVGLATVLSLPQILEDLIRAETPEIEKMYQFIYWQAWHNLSLEARTLLEMMPLAAAIGITPEQMIIMSGLSPSQLWPAVTELINRSLLEVRGTTWERRYGIHRLTESFLQTEIIHWPQSPD